MNTPKVIGLAGFGLEVPDLDAAARFYAAFGLDASRKTDWLGLRNPGQMHDEAVIVCGTRKRLHHIAFTIKSADEGRFAEKLEKTGLKVVSAPTGGHRPGLWFQAPQGVRGTIVPAGENQRGQSQHSNGLKKPSRSRDRLTQPASAIPGAVHVTRLTKPRFRYAHGQRSSILAP